MSGLNNQALEDNLQGHVNRVHETLEKYKYQNEEYKLKINELQVELSKMNSTISKYKPILIQPFIYFYVGPSPITLTIDHQQEPDLVQFKVNVIACDCDKQRELDDLQNKNRVLKSKLMKQKETIEQLTKERKEQEDNIDKVSTLEFMLNR